MSIAIRPARPGDAEAIAAVHVQSWRETYAGLLPEGFFTPERVEGRQELWRQVLAVPRDDMVVRVAESGGAIVGFAWAGPPLDDGDGPPPRGLALYAIYVLAAFQGVGAGQRLLDAAIGGAPAMLRVATRNPRAIAFSRRNGFEPDGDERVDPETPLITDARMVR